MDVFGRNRVALPLANVEREKGFVGMHFRLGKEIVEMGSKVVGQLLVELLTEEMG